jgi:nucleotide-binding universal stress UspA family protein
MKATKRGKVLIALDYNKSAQKVSEEGYLLASSMNAEVILLHVVTDHKYYASVGDSTITGFPSYLELGPLQLNSEEGLKKASNDFLEKSKEHLGDASIETVVAEGDTADTILKTAKELHADIIVMGSHSQKWLESIVMGSATEDVLRHTTLPLFIVPIKPHKN